MIDAHHHLWRLKRPECRWPTSAEAPIFRDFEMPDYRAVATAAGVRASVLVQSQESMADTRWLLETAALEPSVAGVVGWVDLASGGAPGAIEELAGHPKLVGLRPMVQDRPGDWYDDPAITPGIEAILAHGLRFDALVRVQHLASLERLARRYPGLPIVIDHAAKPRIGDDRGFDEWHAAIAPLADQPNIFCKLSGLLTECLRDCRSRDAVAPYVSAMLALFGSERLMWGSDWPVLNLAGNFTTWVDMARALVPHSAHEGVFEATARTFYGLGSVQ